MKAKITALTLVVVLAAGSPGLAFLEDLCLPRPNANGILMWCLRPTCPNPNQNPNRVCPEQTADFATIQPGRSMIHMDGTHFIAQALGYRADVAYWIAAYNEVTDYSQYVPIDQCGVQASNQNAIANQTTNQTAPNTGRDYITAYYNGFQRTNTNTDAPLDHYVVSFSPNGQGTDVHGAMGVQAIYPLYYPRPGYPERIDDTYQKTLANFRQWAMLKTNEPGVLCTVGLTEGDGCLTNARITGTVPFFLRAGIGVRIDVPAGKKVLNYVSRTDIDYYEKLEAYLNDPKKTTGTLWKSPGRVPVPVQLARLGHYLHVMQDTASHSTYCGDDGPTPPGGTDPGTYMFLTDRNRRVQLSFGDSCANSPHLAGHVQETGTGRAPLPLRVYTALNMTVDELIAFGNQVAKHHGWIVNPELLPPDTVGKNGQGKTAADIKAALVGMIVEGTPYSRAEVYRSGVVTLPLQQTNSLDRLHAMNAALASYSDTLRKQSPSPAAFVPLEQMPGNSADPKDRKVCWQSIP